MRQPKFVPDQKWKILLRRARDWWPHDYEELVAEALAIAWERWQRKGYPYFNGEPDIDRIELLVKTAYRRLKKLETPTRDVFSIYTVMENPKMAAHQLTRKLRVNGQVVRFSDAELTRVSGMTQSALGRSRRLGRVVKVFICDGQLYPTMTALQDAKGWTQAKARWHAKTIKMEWV